MAEAPRGDIIRVDAVLPEFAVDDDDEPIEAEPIDVGGNDDAAADVAGGGPLGLL